MWPDNETTEDLIGFRVHADLLRAVVTNPQMLPTTIGIFGDWGSGKTSILKMLEHDLDPDNWPVDSPERERYSGVAVVYANTWLFEGYDDAKAALLSSVLLELAKHKRFGPKVRDGARRLLKRVNWMRLVRFSMTHVAAPAIAAYATGGLAAVPAALAVASGLSKFLPGNAQTNQDEAEESKEGTETAEGWIKEDEASGDEMDVRTFRDGFQKMLKDAGITTLVVLVDDLDRCTPDRIIDNLEAVKLFLSVQQTAFVIGADRRIVEHAIRMRYAEGAIDTAADEDTRRLVKDYLEKLVQIPYSLPRLSSSEIATYMTLLFCGRHYSKDGFDKCLIACNEGRGQNRYASFGFAGVRAAMGNQELDPELAEALTLTAAAAPQIADGLKGNPRQVKRFLNALLLRKKLARVAKLEHIRDTVLIKLMILEYVHPELFLQLFNWQAQQNGFPKELAAMEETARKEAPDEESSKQSDQKWTTSATKRWLSMEPPLSSIDLRDYFWVARDRLESSFVGLAMVPPIVRRLLEDLLSGAAPKRNSAMATAKTISEDERASLLDLIEQRITRQLDDKSGFDALRSLIEAGVDGAADRFAGILLHNPLDKVSPAVGMDLVNLRNAKPELREILDPVKEHIGKSQTAIGKAVHQGKTRKPN
jgi:hypothetical protein